MGAATQLEDLLVKRITDETLAISWRQPETVAAVMIYDGPSPETVDLSRPMIEVPAGQRRVEIKSPKEHRRYFKVALENSPSLTTAERRFKIDGTYNFRDLGGYEGVGGKRVKWGRIFRSDAFSRLTEKGLAQLASLGLKTIVDFRSSAEVKKAPDRLPESGPHYISDPIQTGEMNFTAAMEKIDQGDASWLTEDFMRQGYIKNIDQFPLVWARFFQETAKSRRTPLAFHCTGGKDRAGTAAALFLLVMGVAEETVIADHQLTNPLIAPLLAKINQYVESKGIEPDRLKPYFTAPLDCIQTLLYHLKTKYGGAEKYLIEQGGLTEELLESVRRTMLED